MTQDIDIHSCSYFCDRPDCIRAQRDQLAELLIGTEPSTAHQDQAIALAAQHRVGYLQWLAAHLQEPKYSGMLPVGRADIRNAAAHELIVLAEGCK